MVPTANFLITPGVLFCLVISPHWRYKLFPHGAEDSHFLTSSTVALFSPSCDERSSLTNYLFLLSFDDGNILWSKSLEIFCYLYSHLTVTTLQDDGSKFSWLSKSLHAQEVLLRMQGNPVLFQMNRVWNCFCCWRESWVWRIVGKLKVGSPWCEPHPLPPTLPHMWRNIGKLRVLQIRCRYICLDLKLGNFHLCCSWHHFVEGFFSLISFSCIVARFRGCFCDFGLFLMYCHIRNWVCVHNEAAVFWTSACSVIAAKEVTIRLLLSALGSDARGGNFKLIPCVLVCSAELISKQTRQRS